MAVVLPTETSIANRALQHVGAARLTNIWTDVSKNAVEIQSCYHMVRQAELRRNVWRFSIREVACRPVLIPNTTNPNLSSTQMASKLMTFGAWSSTASYGINDIVLGSDGRPYYSKISGNIGTDPTSHNWAVWTPFFGVDNACEYVTTWSAALTYNIGMHSVAADGSTYVSLQDGNINHNPTAGGSPTFWSVTTDGAVTTSTAFFSGEFVYTGTRVYISLADGNTTIPGAAGASWVALTSAPSLANYNFIYPIGISPQFAASPRYPFRLPIGFLRKAPQAPKQGSYRWLGAPSNNFYDDWQFENNYFTSTDIGVVVLRFAADVDDPTLMDPMFREGFAARIAIAVCPPITQSSAKMQEITAIYKQFMTDARLVNGIETGPTEPPLDSYLASRY